jgi:hypothetical protein
LGLARISHTFSEQIAALPIEIAFQVGEDSVHATRPRLLERQDHRAGCASCQRKCEKCGLAVTTMALASWVVQRFCGSGWSILQNRNSRE